MLVYNVEYGGGPATDRVMRQVDADVVGVLESYERLPEIAEATGYPHYNTSLQLLSKYPIHEPSGADGLYALIEVRPGYVVPFFNVHLDYVEWGPRALERGDSLASVMANEDRVRTSALAEPLHAMEELLDEGYPVFLTGDFNQPSSLDYAADTVGTRKGIDEAVPWPVSEELLEIGFRDTYREVHPDPVKEPGITQERTGERIDYVYAAGPSETLDSRIVGEPGGRDVEIDASPWTSDHRAVLSSFEVEPMAMPTMVSVDARLRDVGDTITVAYNAPGSDSNEIAVITEGEEPDSAVERLDASDESGTAELATAALEPGGYEAVILDDGGEVARVSFWLRDPRAEVQFSTDKRSYERGEPIEVAWSNGPANRWDWLGVYEASASDPKIDDYLIWAYTGLHASGTTPPSTEGTLTLGRDAQGKPWPLPPGEYVVHYLLADQYNSAASSRFTVSR